MTVLKHQSSLGIKYPKDRDVPEKSSFTWLEGKRHDDGAEGLWRIHDDIYDLTKFLDKHPGGKDWLSLTKGTDITEAFEAHHITLKPEKLLPDFHVKKASTPRNYPFTFKEDGFYRTLKRKVREELKNIPKPSPTLTNSITDFLLLMTFTLSITAAKTQNYLLGALSGIFLTLTVIASHNCFHSKDNFRMYYFDLSLMGSRDWRISHALSHHLYTNCINDLEISMFEPLLEYMPKPKSLVKRYVSWIYVFLVWATLYHFSLVKRYLAIAKGGRNFSKEELIPFVLPLIMSLFANNFLNAFLMWNFIILVGSLHFGIVGLNAAHHHPEIFHDGDTPRPEVRDWGIHQLDAVMDRKDINGNLFLVLTNFGDHGFHHFFPTLDHGTLRKLHPVIERTMRDFGLHLRMKSQLEMVRGQFNQLARVEPNSRPPYS